ncbi:MAG: hypothetical protein ABSC19_16520, partial [Syntrophorhabdales bacterium]
MGLYRRGPTWWMSFTYNGRQVRQSTETDDKKLAEKIHHKVMTEVAEGKWFERQERTRTFAEMMEKYMKEHSKVKKRSSSRDEVSLKHLLPFFGACPLKDVSPSLIPTTIFNNLLPCTTMLILLFSPKRWRGGSLCYPSADARPI